MCKKVSQINVRIHGYDPGFSIGEGVAGGGKMSRFSVSKLLKVFSIPKKLYETLA
jgi:hypothetical protein